MLLAVTYQVAALLLLAQESGTETVAKKTAEVVNDKPSLFGDNWFLMLMGMMAIYLIVMMLFPKRDNKKQSEELLKGLKKNDRVLTIAGIKGTVVNIAEDSPWATIRIDESTNTKMQVLRSSISRVLTDDKKLEETTEK